MHDLEGIVERMSACSPFATRGTILATRSAAELIGDLNAHTQRIQIENEEMGLSPKGRKWRNTGSSISSGTSSTHRAVAAKAEIEEDFINYSGDEEEAVTEPTSESQERARDKEILQSFLRSREREGAREKSHVENKQSVKWLANNTGAGEIISTPREYQVELFERAKAENIIAVLDTGSGKTLIAVLLLQHVIKEELERRALGLDKRISFFLVDSVALVFQQAAVLKCNLNQKVEQFCGDMGCDLWSKDHWMKHFNDNMVIVLTAEVLYQCLHHSFIKMSQINLLIFDEAHHAKKNHPYARIIKDFYVSDADKSTLPRLFGMTASPVDARVDVTKAAMELEALLHCRIATSVDASLLQHTKAKAKEELLANYEPLLPPFQTDLFTNVYEKIAGIKACQKPLIFARKASSELGAWASDEVFRFSFGPDEAQRIKANIESRFHKFAQRDGLTMDHLNQMKGRLEESADIIANHNFETPQLNPNFLSSKVLQLARYLHERYENTTDDKCIVFVNQRLTAKLLSDLFSLPDIGTPHLRVGTLVGTRNGQGSAEVTVSFRSQMLTLRRFRSGELNCLFATSVAEEGLDIPDCNLIVRFDLYTTVIQYIQSRGRARLANSKYLHFMEAGNQEHIALIREVRNNANKLEQFCRALPEDRLLTGNNYNMDYILAKERSSTRTYTEPTTGAKLTYRMALGTLANFVASLPHTAEQIPNPEYIMGRQGDKFLCEVILPDSSPVHGAIGRPATQKQIAKCSAAFECCLLLRKGGHLDAHLVSTFKNMGPQMRNARLALGSKAKIDYDMKTKPELWKAGVVPQELYLTIFHLADRGQMGCPSQPLGLLTRGPMPRIPEFYLFFGKQERTALITTSLPDGLKFDEETRDRVQAFTLRIFSDIYSKQYESDISKMPYFLVPITESVYDDADFSNAWDIIAWDVIKTVHKHKTLPWALETTEDSFFTDRYIFDPFDGSRKFYAKKVAPEYSATDPIPPNTAKRIDKWYRIMREDYEDKDRPPNIIQYSNSMFKQSRKLRKFSENQPVIEADLIPVRRNFLDDRSFHGTEDETTNCYIVPEPLSISALPTKVVAMAYCVPAIIHRVESYLIALEACSMLNIPLSPDLALECLTKDSQNTGDHGEDAIAFQRGMGQNYERLEFYGDCFLKMATSISLYGLYPDDNELDFHVKRMLMICNKNLMTIAKQLRLYEYIRSEGFNRRNWYPEGLELIAGNRKVAKNAHALGDKTIADIPEALIGAALLTPGEEHPFDTAVRAVTELVCCSDHSVQKWSEYYERYKKPKYQLMLATAAQADLAQQVEQIVNYHFKYPRLLRSAFTHSTYPFMYERIPNYQRLEFIGDSLLDMVCVRYLFHLFPNKDPQWLTEHKMAMVSNQFLGALCVELGFYKHLMHFQPIITNGIVDYVSEFEEAKAQAIADALAAGKTEKDFARDFWLHTKHPPKYLADMIESFVGALFVDSEFSFHEVERFFDNCIRPFFTDVHLYDTFANNHPVTALNKFFEQKMGCVKYHLNATQLSDDGLGAPPRVVATVMVHGRIVCHAERESARYSKVAVAEEALKLLKGGSPAEFRGRWGCDCKVKGRLEVAEAAVVEKIVKKVLGTRMRDWDSTSESESSWSRKSSAVASVTSIA